MNDDQIHALMTKMTLADCARHQEILRALQTSLEKNKAAGAVGVGVVAFECMQAILSNEAERLERDEILRNLLGLTYGKVTLLEDRRTAGGVADTAGLAKLLAPVFAAIGTRTHASVKASEAELVDLVAGIERRLAEVEKKTTRRSK